MMDDVVWHKKMYLQEIFLERVKPETHVVSYVSQWASTENTL